MSNRGATAGVPTIHRRSATSRTGRPIRSVLHANVRVRAGATAILKARVCRRAGAAAILGTCVCRSAGRAMILEASRGSRATAMVFRTKVPGRARRTTVAVHLMGRPALRATSARRDNAMA
jgi:hypothetical protein